MSSRNVLLLSAAALLAAGASSAVDSGSHSAEVKLDTATTVSGKLLSPGDYRFSWSEATNKVDVTIEKGHEVVAKAEASVKELPQPPSEKEVISRTTKTGSRVLEQLRLRGDTTALVFSGS
jgi:hypothetical protein